MSSPHTYFAELGWRVSIFPFMLSLTLPPAFDFLKGIGQVFGFHATRKPARELLRQSKQSILNLKILAYEEIWMQNSPSNCGVTGTIYCVLHKNGA